MRANADGPLSGVRVVDWTMYGVGPFASSLLGALGADVVKIERPPSGDPQLQIGPYVNGVATLYVNFNTSKRCVHLDLTDGTDRQYMWRLIERADVLVTNFRPGTAERLGFTDAEIATRNPGLVYVSCTGWGEDGPMRKQGGADPAVQAFCGWCSITGDEGGAWEFLRYLGHIDMNASLYITAAVLTGLVARPEVGGQRMQLSMLETALSMQSNRIVEYLNVGALPAPLGSASAVVAPSQAFRCQDQQYLAVSTETEAQWHRLVEAVGCGWLAHDSRFATNRDRVRNRHALAAHLETVFAARPLVWWLHTLRRHRVPASKFWDWDDIQYHPQVLANDHVVLVDTGRCGPLHTGGPPWTFANARAEVARNCYTGEHTAEIKAELDSPAGLPSRGGGAGQGLPLAGVRVVELTRGIAGPYCGALLADNGAAVTKVETGTGDHLRGWGPLVEGVSPAFLELNRNKDVVWIDPARDRDALLEMLGRADVILVDAIDTDGNPPPVTEDEVRSANPSVVWCSLSHYGETGELASWPGSELTVQAMSNTWAGLGRAGDAPLRLGADQASMNAGIVAYQGVLAALFRRQRTGEGDRVSASVLGALLCIKGMHWTSLSNPDDWAGMHVHVWTDPRSTGYRTADLPIMFHLPRHFDRDFDNLALDRLVGRLGGAVPDGMKLSAPVGDAAYPTNPAWKPFWERLFAAYSWAELAEVFTDIGGEVTPFNDYHTLMNHPQVKWLEPFVAVSSDAPRLLGVKVPWRTTAHPGGLTYRAPVEVDLDHALEER